MVPWGLCAKSVFTGMVDVDVDVHSVVSKRRVSEFYLFSNALLFDLAWSWDRMILFSTGSCVLSKQKTLCL